MWTLTQSSFRLKLKLFFISSIIFFLFYVIVLLFYSNKIYRFNLLKFIIIYLWQVIKIL